MTTTIRLTNDLVIGAFYEATDGRIALTSGWDGKERRVRVLLDDGTGEHWLPESEWADWTRRLDLQDFPNARDPRLPYTFDLNWDLKTRSQLVGFLKSLDTTEVKDAMAQYGITLGADVDAGDQALPPTFDFFWDLTTRAQLAEFLQADATRAEVEGAMRDHGLVLTAAEVAQIKGDHASEADAPQP